MSLLISQQKVNIILKQNNIFCTVVSGLKDAQTDTHTRTQTDMHTDTQTDRQIDTPTQTHAYT